MSAEKKRYAEGGSGTSDNQGVQDVTERSFPWGLFFFGIVFGGAAIFAGWKFLPGPWSHADEARTAVDSTRVSRPAAIAASPEAERPASTQAGGSRSAPIGESIRRPLAEVGEPSTLPDRSDSEVRRKMQENHQALSLCYQAGQANDPTIEGTVVVSFRIESDGTVSDAKVKSSTLGSPTTEKCITQAITTWRFQPGKKAEEFELDFPFAR